jgi:hypothetical protein
MTRESTRSEENTGTLILQYAIGALHYLVFTNTIYKKQTSMTRESTRSEENTQK